MKKKCYLCGMFVEKKQNKSGSTSVRIIQKVHGKRKCVKVIGCSSDAEEIGLLIKLGSRWIEEHQTGVPLFEFDDEAIAYDKVLQVCAKASFGWLALNSSTEHCSTASAMTR